MSRDWSPAECEEIVADYFEMLESELTNLPFNKAEHRRKLEPKLDERTKGSIEFKHQNISAILLRAGKVYIRGYKPAWNYQSLLEKVVFDHLARFNEGLTKLEDALLAETSDPSQVNDWESLFVLPPERTKELKVRERKPRQPRIINFAARELRNRQLGERGEQFVVNLERIRLTNLGKNDLAKEVEWTSKEKGDGAGYDVRSFQAETDQELFIEVKTTNSGKYQPFLISENEVEFSKDFSGNYSLYRVFNFSRSPSLFELKGAVDGHVILRPKIYSAYF